jgi:hypothetical protein
VSDVEEHPSQEGSRSGDLDPDVPQEVALDLTWPTAPGQPPPLVRVLVRDERQWTTHLFGHRGSSPSSRSLVPKKSVTWS